MEEKITTRESCFVRDAPVLDFFEVRRYLFEKGYGDLHDEMFEMFPYLEDVRNDSYCHLYRHWIKTDTGKTIFDAIVEELDLTWEEPGYLQTLIDKGLRTADSEKDWLQIIFWISW